MGVVPNSSSSMAVKGGVEVSLDPETKVAFTSKQSAYRRGTAWGDSCWPPPTTCRSLHFFQIPVAENKTETNNRSILSYMCEFRNKKNLRIKTPKINNVNFFHLESKSITFKILNFVFLYHLFWFSVFFMLVNKISWVSFKTEEISKVKFIKERKCEKLHINNFSTFRKMHFFRRKLEIMN